MLYKMLYKNFIDVIKCYTMEKKLKAYRLNEEALNELKEIVSKLGVSETEAIIRAIHFFYLSLESDEELIRNTKIVRFEEYQKVQQQLSQMAYKLGELEGSLKEKDKLIEEKEKMINKIEKDKEKQIQSLQSLIDKILESQKQNTKKWWRFWK